MARMDLKEIHERLMLYKMVRQVVENSKSSVWEKTKQEPWLCNVYEGGNDVHVDTLH